MSDVKEKVYEFVSKVFQVPEEELRDETSLLGDLNANSVKYFPLMSAIEDEYDLELQYQQFRSECKTVGDIVAMVEREA